jgi:DNA (cytosine-5)-methyltransferase 1
MGYHKAGFEVVGVDIDPQPNYPFEFHQADALTFPLDGFDVIHASPPCQGYSTAVTSHSSKYVRTKGKDEPRLISAIRERVKGIPYVIENVAGARDFMESPILLCGSMFGLMIPRHRYFESNMNVPEPTHPKCRGMAKRSSERTGWEYREMSVTGKGRSVGTSERWKQILGIDWHMTQHDLVESIPPAYTEYIGKYIMEKL